MSGFVTCNYCSMRRIEAEAKTTGKRIVKKRSAFWGGINVFLVPESVDVPKVIKEPSSQLPNGDNFYEKYNEAWFMTISTFCVCNS